MLHCRPVTNAEDCIRSATAQSSFVTKHRRGTSDTILVLNRVRPPPPMGIQSAPAFSTEGFPFETVALGRREAPKPRAGPTSGASGKRATGEQSRRGGGEHAIAVTPSTAKRFSTKRVIRHNRRNWVTARWFPDFSPGRPKARTAAVYYIVEI